MPKIATLVRSFSMTEEFNAILTANLMATGDLAPGQLWKSGEWYALTYLRTNKYSIFNPATWEDDSKEVNIIKAVKFRRSVSKLLVRGSTSNIEMVVSYFRTLLLGKSDDEGKVDYDSYFKVSDPNIDLGSILGIYQEEDRVENVRKIKMKKVEITLGHINNCTVVTDDYGGASKSISEEEAVTGMEIAFKDKKKTTLYMGVDGAIRITTKSAEVDIEELLIEAADLI